ncbi:MAG: hypothetical protein IH589_02635 [Anaerolineales bacterium]|nr:hypothetical protein [Anaerolineales bacterium]
MFRSYRFYFSLAAMMIASPACAVLGAPELDFNTSGTAAAQTVIAGLTQSPPTLEIPLTPTFTFTVTSEPPAITPASTTTPTPFVIFTATSAVPLMSVSVPTNCRNGPGKVYSLEGSLLVGEIAEVYGRDPTSKYWYIRNPDPGAEFCWAWGEYATITGSPLLLPILTPPPTPTPTMTPTPSPSFDAEFNNLDSCAGWWMDIEVKNTGTLPFKSLKIEMKDTDTEVELTAFLDGFTDLDGCLKTTVKDTLYPGDIFLISSPALNYNPHGHGFRVFMTLCTEKSQKGGCVTKKINFKP